MREMVTQVKVPKRLSFFTQCVRNTEVTEPYAVRQSTAMA